MLSEVDILLGLSLEANETNNDRNAIIEKAKFLNRDVSPVLRKSIIVPIVQAINPKELLDKKCDDFFARQHMRRGIR